MQTQQNIEEQTIRQWTDALIASIEGPKWQHNFCEDIKAKWPYISMVAPSDYETEMLAHIGHNARWAKSVHNDIAKLADQQYFVIATFGGELVIAFNDIATAVMVKLQIKPNDEFYTVTYGNFT